MNYFSSATFDDIWIQFIPDLITPSVVLCWFLRCKLLRFLRTIGKNYSEFYTSYKIQLIHLFSLIVPLADCQVILKWSVIVLNTSLNIVFLTYPQYFLPLMLSFPFLTYHGINKRMDNRIVVQDKGWIQHNPSTFIRVCTRKRPQ